MYIIYFLWAAIFSVSFVYYIYSYIIVYKIISSACRTKGQRAKIIISDFFEIYVFRNIFNQFLNHV